MTSDVTIRRATESDAGALAALAERTFRDTFGDVNTPQDMQRHCNANFSASIQLEEIRAADRDTWLAEADGLLVAFAQLRRGAAPPAVGGARPLEIQRFYVAAGHHGRGVAHDLMQHVLSQAEAQAVDVVWLGVWEKNPRAVAFYRKWGFEIVGDHVFTLGEDRQRDLLMRRILR